MKKFPESDMDALILKYARAKWGKSPDLKSAEKIGEKLGRDLRLRLDALGIDGERLLDIEPRDTMLVLEQLEREAELENFAAVQRHDAHDGAAVVRTNLRGVHASRYDPVNRANGGMHGPDRRRQPRRSDR